MARETGETIRGLVDLYTASQKWHASKPNSQKIYRIYLRHLSELWGDRVVSSISVKDVHAMMEGWGERRQSANVCLQLAREIFKHAVMLGLIDSSPARDVSPIRVKTDGANPWPAWALDLIHEHSRWEIRNAVMLALYTGQRTSDVVRMSLRDFESGYVSVRQEKTGRALRIPVHPKLEPILADARQRGYIVLVPGPNGAALAPENFRRMFYREIEKPWAKPIKDAGLSMHGLRKLAVDALLEAGCPVAKTAAIVGMSMRMVEHYGKKRDQALLADRAMRKWLDQ